MSHLPQPSVPAGPSSSLTGANQRCTISQIIRYFAAGLPLTSNYPRHARAYLDDCLANGYGVDDWSFETYTAGRKPNCITPVRQFLKFYRAQGAPQIVADPPRKGLGRELAGRIGAVGARRIVHVACDPAALARDVAALAEAGYTLAGLRVFDAFPMTHHVECVATLVRT